MTDESDTDALILRKIADQIAQGIEAGSAGSPPRGTAVPGPSTTSPLTPAALHLAQLAHELKTPLSAIVAAAEIMRDERFGPVGDPRYQGYASGIYDSAHHALGVINAMLPDASPQTGGAVTFTELDLNELADQTAQSVRALLEAAGLSVGHRLEPGLPHIVADPVTVRQMLLNLVTNAMRATPAGGHIVISTAYDLAGPVHLTVTDTGDGMSDPDIGRALDPSRSADFKPRPSGGFGLGFPLILQLARLNGAHVGITSTFGKGTAVQITFAADRVIPV